ncbi:MAG TPA: archaetidylserine decarboxylase [Polyangiaceae bacterium LLY-WYZ-15_(1-7)]|nr:archaetidylserine decarboxylase [Polyangiaceae bacterium LLY-WYZ-15_(1-7)]
MGRLADLRAPSPLLEQAVDAFARSYDIDLGEAVVPPGGFKTFDEFFTRKLREGARPADPDPGAVLSPADGRVEDLGPIDPEGSLLVKGRRYEVAELLGDAASAERYRGGSYFIVYLSPRDYHRVHAPVSGAVVELRHVPGTLYPVNAIGVTHVPQLFAKNERVAVVQRTERRGEVATIMVGAIGVGRISVCFDDLVTNVGRAPGVRRYGEDGPPIERAEELGVFHIGSTAIVFVPPEAGASRFVVTAGAQVRVGQAILRGEGAEGSAP